LSPRQLAIEFGLDPGLDLPHASWIRANLTFMPASAITLEALGWTSDRESAFRTLCMGGLEPGRVAVEDKHHYVILRPGGEVTGHAAGKLLHRTRSAADLPKVGDWVAISCLPNEAKALIHHVLPRKTKLSRKVAGRELEEQVLATNIDKAFVVQALDSTFNLALLRRHLVMVFESGARPAVILNKADLAEDLSAKLVQAREAATGVEIVIASATTRQGIEELNGQIAAGQTVVFIGSSGVGKSSLINDLCGEEVQATEEVRESDSKGRHTTAWRELILLPSGGLVIDTPGMREFHMWTAHEGMREAFADLDALASQCRFTNCRHAKEKGCAVLAAVTSGQVPVERYQSYLKLKKEQAFLENAQRKHAWMQRRRQARVAQRAPNQFEAES
jgi:ribosome biogenesis GTPase